ncbi:MULTISPECIES: hypothetical protein [Psychrobacillus]|uniref:hypothetical protein n=1 Tax=Psychrobacillus TaxID=1221880 RepID=UPI0008EEB0EB|nr:hypothetical protein [Psychrobacillus psychrodurans]MCZ8542152.1 hypothetical protein [Psychrobacillus psychrodurans]SFN17280.1 hypothetical protein SAMN05421832_11810 [Psychrobacillus psychrodurans]
MATRTWDVKEQFRFPQSFGVPKEIKNVAVTPQCEIAEKEDFIQVVGIYHITCHVKFEEGEEEHHATSEFTEIEDLDLQGEVGYFEYAVPMSIEIGKDKLKEGSKPTVHVNHINSKPTQQMAIEVGWTVHCEYEEAPEPEPTPVTPLVEAESPNPAEPMEVKNPQGDEFELQFILDLDDGYSKLSFPSNNIFVKQKADE